MGERGRLLDPAQLSERTDALYRVAWAMSGDRYQAEDLVQETFSRVLAKPRFLRNDDDLGYLIRTLRNVFYSSLRSKRDRPVDDSEVEFEDTQGAERYEVQSQAREIYGLIAELPEPYGEAIAAVDVAGLTYEEAARALKVPVGTVRSRLFRARDRVATMMEEGGAGTIPSPQRPTDRGRDR